jgi:alkylated DNA repair dioxygenase AlkB
VTTAIHTAQSQLFGTDDLLPPGLVFAPDFISQHEEADLLAVAAALPLREARYKEYTARRRVYAFGSRFDFDAYKLRPRAIGELPQPLAGLRDKLAPWAGVEAGDFVHVMVSEYAPGTPLGWHRDAPDYEVIVGVSLGSPARLRFRPWAQARNNKEDIVALDLAPRSAYLMRGVARWGWQHSVPPVPGLRYSVTMRTMRM